MVTSCRAARMPCSMNHWPDRDGHPPDRECQVCGCPGYVPKPWGMSAALHLRDLCLTNQVSFWWKQFGGPRPTSGGHLIDGAEYRELPR